MPTRSAPAPAVRSHPWHHRRHHAADGFRNVWGDGLDVPFWKTATWLVQHGLQRKHNVPPPVRRRTAADLAPPEAGLRVTWIGHSTAYLQWPDLAVLTDPVFADRASPVPVAGPDRAPDLPLQPTDLPAVDLVLVSHDHYDHLDRQAVAALEQRFHPRFACGLGVGRRLRAWGARDVLEMDWWQYAELDGLRLHGAPARHFSGRSLTDRNRTLWLSWYVERPDVRLYFAGDSAYADHFEEVRTHVGAPDVVLMPIGAYAPRWFMSPVHMDPAEALQACADLDARHVVPIHWGTFDLSDEPIHEPIVLARRHAADLGLTDRLHPLDIGGQVHVGG